MNGRRKRALVRALLAVGLTRYKPEVYRNHGTLNHIRGIKRFWQNHGRLPDDRHELLESEGAQ